MEERLTYEEMRLKYPDQWVGLKDPIWEEESCTNLISGIVIISDKTMDELTILALTEGLPICYIYSRKEDYIVC